MLSGPLWAPWCSQSAPGPLPTSRAARSVALPRSETALLGLRAPASAASAWRRDVMRCRAGPWVWEQAAVQCTLGPESVKRAQQVGKEGCPCHGRWGGAALKDGPVLGWPGGPGRRKKNGSCGCQKVCCKAGTCLSARLQNKACGERCSDTLHWSVLWQRLQLATLGGLPMTGCRCRSSGLLKVA